ncbi:heat shock protein beta-1 [Eurytemora carolleeae]|uniref:heat shock protein beta-1 n=1 Tax=Eurytemora carolleeae TaxID=1294199 RepID=UPI000C76CA59|nr:heat shock protein beta-1 [Eurytemora carolleeae]|eukprot:XP_023342946.1 heat shock protein beta-1-like [Eurytemora affinis]
MSGEEQRVPMRIGDFSVLDSEFNSIKDRFDNEMKKMEDEMNRFRSELISRESSVFRKSGSSSVVSSSSESRTLKNGEEVEGSKSSFMSSTSTGDHDLVPGVTGGLGGHSAWLQGLNSPLLKDKVVSAGGVQEKELKLRFDVSQYSPEEIIVKTVDNKLLVQAKHEENSNGRTVYREYNREFLLPQGTDPELIKSSLSKDGILTVEAPLPTPAIK